MQRTPHKYVGHSAYSRQKRLLEIGVISLGFVMIPLFQGFLAPASARGIGDAASFPSILGFVWELVLLLFLIHNGMPRLLKMQQYWTINWMVVLRGLALGFVLLALASIPGMFLPSHENAAVPFAFPTNTLAWILTGVTLIVAVLLEELLYRIYYLERLISLGANPRAAILVSVPLFAIGHSYQGITGIVLAALAGTVLALAWLRWKSYWTNCVGHLVYNLTVLAVTFLYR